MQTIMKRSVVKLVALAAAMWLVGPLAAAHSASAADEVAPGLKVGDVLEKSNCQLAKDLLPPEVLRHYCNGEYRNRIVAYPTGNYHCEKEFEAATEQNAAQLDVDSMGSIIYKSSGKQPPYYYGIPFPIIDEKEPKAGVKVVWNQFLSYWQGGTSYNTSKITMLTPNALDRELVADGWWKFYEGQHPKFRNGANPLNLQSQFLGAVTSPADLQGTATLTWRYRDPGKRDSVWAYVPALRRVRAVSPANRSDGYLGSDISADDGFFFDGKPEEFEWTAAGKREGLAIADPNSVSGPLKIDPVEGGGWHSLIPPTPPTIGYLTPGWTGISWAPVDPALVKRVFWVVQGVPRDKYYLYGKIELWIDAETWTGAWSRKFNWTGELVQTYSATAKVNHPAGPADDREWIPANSMIWTCAENIKMNRATIAGQLPYANAAYYRRINIDANHFEPNTLNRFGK